MDIEKELLKYNSGKHRGAAKKLADKLNISPSAMSQILDGGMKIPKDLRLLICKELKIPPDLLPERFPQREQRNAAAHGQASLAAEPSLFYPVQYVPVIGVVSAERFNVALETPPDDVLPIPVTGPAGKYFALRVSGRCMEPTAHDGQYVVVAQAAEIPDGKLGIFRLNEECTLKRLFRMKDGACELRPDNPKYEKIVVKCGDLKVVGLVIGFFQKP